MIKRIATVGGWTLVSRISGFIRDVVMAAVLGAGPMADAFFVAFRLPNHFRAIFAEGAFAAAFVPAYARVLQQAGIDPAKLFADRIAAALIAINLVLLSLALLFTPWVVSVLAPGLVNDPTRFDLAVALTRITFPYLALVSLETLLAGVLNANQRFAAAAGAPVLLNMSLIATLLLRPISRTPAMPPPGAWRSRVWRKCCSSPSTPRCAASASGSACRSSTRTPAAFSRRSARPSSAPAACSLRFSPTR